MLGPGRYLLGVVEIAILVVPAWLGAARVRSRLLPRLTGSAAHLASAVLALALLIWAAELLGTFSLFEPLPYLLLVAACGGGSWFFIGDPALPEGGAPRPRLASRSGSVPLRRVAVALSLLVAAVALVHFAGGVRTRLGTGMTGFDSTWYHGPFAAGFFQSGDTWRLHFIAPQFLAWFYPANSEVLHAVGMLAFGRDVLSPLLNLGWFAGCLVACWAIGKPFRVAPLSLALGAIALSVPALADQAGEARNDIVGIFFLLAAVAVTLNAAVDEVAVTANSVSGGRGTRRETGRARSLPVGALVLAGLAVGLAAGTKLNFLLPAAVLVLGLVVLAPAGARWRALASAGLPALAGGGYWYLRNLAHTGNPLPWIHHLGPISLPSPGQTLGGREAHSVLGYLTNGSVWSDWFLPGLHHALWLLWPLLALAALLGLLLALIPARTAGRRDEMSSVSRQIGPSTPGGSVGGGGALGGALGGAGGALALAGIVGLATALAWLVAPTSASGPAGMPRGFESGVRYLAPALVLGLALLPAVPLLRPRLSSLATAQPPSSRLPSDPDSGSKGNLAGGRTEIGRPWAVMMLAVLAAVAVVVGYPVQRHYLAHRYEDPSFTTPGLNAAFAWARNLSGARIATTGTRQYPLFGTDLSNRVQYLGERTPHGGFEPPPDCPTFRRLLNQGHYDYLVATRDRIEPGKKPYPPQAAWVEGTKNAEAILKKPPSVVFKLSGPLDPSACSE